MWSVMRIAPPKLAEASPALRCVTLINLSEQILSRRGFTDRGLQAGSTGGGRRESPRAHCSAAPISCFRLMKGGERSAKTLKCHILSTSEIAPLPRLPGLRAEVRHRADCAGLPLPRGLGALPRRGSTPGGGLHPRDARGLGAPTTNQPTRRQEGGRTRVLQGTTDSTPACKSHPEPCIRVCAPLLRFFNLCSAPCAFPHHPDSGARSCTCRSCSSSSPAASRTPSATSPATPDDKTQQIYGSQHAHSNSNLCTAQFWQ